MPWPADPARRAAGAGNCARFRESVDAYVDLEPEPGAGLDREDAGGGLEPAERAALEAHAAGCPDCRAELALARRLRQGLRDGLPLLSCPPEVSAEVLRIARLEAEAEAARDRGRSGSEGRLSQRLRAWLTGGGTLRPALVAAALLLLLLAGPLLYRTVAGPGDTAGERPGVAGGGSEPAPGDTFTEAEVAEAEEQVRLVLAYVASVGRDAGRAVQEDVFDPGIARPTRRAAEGLQAAGLTGSTAPAEPPAGRNRP